MTDRTAQSASGSSSISGIGTAIRELRRHRALSTRALARLAGVSQPLLSSIENGRTQPSVPSLYAIANALGVGPSALLPAADTSVVRSMHGMPLAPGDAPITLTLLHAAPSHAIEAFRVELAAGHRDEVPFQHIGEDMIHILAGAMVLECGESATQLIAGDTVLLEGTAPHSFATSLDSSAVVLVITVH